MPRITPTQVFQNGVARHTALPCSEKISTEFRATYSFSLPANLVDLLKTLNKRVNLSREMEIPIRKAAAKIARSINKSRPKGRGPLIGHK